MSKSLASRFAPGSEDAAIDLAPFSQKEFLRVDPVLSIPSRQRLEKIE